MNTHVFLATLGQRPEAITMALDALLQRYHYTEIVILHTDPNRSGISDALRRLEQILSGDYSDLTVRAVEIRYPDGSPLLDLSDQYSSESYYKSLLKIILHYCSMYQPIHLLVAGGRKAMSVYAALAAAFLFGEYDRLWTIHTPPDLMKVGLYHMPPGSQDLAQLIQLPIMPSRLLPSAIAQEDLEGVLKRAQTSPRQLFLQSLTREEEALASLVQQHPYTANAELAAILGKSSKTIENQFRAIYSKLFTYFDLEVDDKYKRQALVDILAGRV